MKTPCPSGFGAFPSIHHPIGIFSAASSVALRETSKLDVRGCPRPPWEILSCSPRMGRSAGKCQLNGTQNGWFIREKNPVKIDDLGVPLFQKTTKWWLNVVYHIILKQYGKPPFFLIRKSSTYRQWIPAVFNFQWIAAQLVTMMRPWWPWVDCFWDTCCRFTK